MPTAILTPTQLLGPLSPDECKYAPERFYVAGDPGILETGARVAIVGSRQASPAGLARARKLARRLASEGIVVVSGLALGIDTAAHTAAMEAGGRTVAVIGTPLERAYPPENAPLQARIAAEHLLISQFAPGTKTQRFHFPQRNRTMALIADATVIIEASETSGALGQGREALRLGRLFYIARALVEDPGLHWPAKLLAQGARILSDETVAVFIDAIRNCHASKKLLPDVRVNFSMYPAVNSSAYYAPRPNERHRLALRDPEGEVVGVNLSSDPGIGITQ